LEIPDEKWEGGNIELCLNEVGWSEKVTYLTENGIECGTLIWPC